VRSSDETYLCRREGRLGIVFARNGPVPKTGPQAQFGCAILFICERRFSSLTHQAAPTRKNTAFPRSRLPILPRAYAYPAPVPVLPPPALCPGSRQRTTAWRRPGKEERDRDSCEMLFAGWRRAGGSDALRSLAADRLAYGPRRQALGCRAL